MKSKLIILLPLLIVLITCFSAIDAEAQCAMCRATVENNVSSGESRIGSSLNTGILYLMSMPYLIGAVIAYFWYRNSQKNKAKRMRIAGFVDRDNA